MTTHPTAAAATGLPEPTHTLDELCSDADHLHHLLDAAMDDLIGAGSPAIKEHLARTTALLWIARDMAKQLYIGLASVEESRS